MNFRKGILALAAVGFGLTGTAFAQGTPVSCTGNAVSPTFVRAEGTTEAIPTIVLTGCTTGATPPATVSIVVTTSAGVANQATSSSTTNTDAVALFAGGTSVPGVVVGNTLVFNNIPVPAPNAGALPNLTIASVRVNASSVPPNTNVTASVQGTSGLILTNNTGIVVGYTQMSVAKPLVLGYTNQAICSNSTNAIPLLQAEIVGGFPGAFAAENGGTNALYVAVTFGNLVAGVNYYVPVNIAGTAGTAAGDLVDNMTSATLVSGNSSTSTVTGAAIPSSSNAEIPGVAQLTVANGSATALYLITGGSTTATSAFITNLYAVTTSGATAGANGPVTVAAALMGASNGKYDQFSTTIVPTATPTVNNATGNPIAFATANITVGGVTYTTGGTTDYGVLTSCATTLLFPYILNTGGYDTGIALTNASAGSTVAQSGTCSMTFYGSGAPSAPYTTSSVSSGTVDAFTVSSVAPGFQGYAIAVCNFQNGHGFAFITDGYGQPGRGLSQGYLAVVTSSTVSQTSF